MPGDEPKKDAKDAKAGADKKGKDGKDGKESKPKAAVQKPLTPAEVLQRNLVLLDKYVDTRDSRFLTRVMRFTNFVRVHLPLAAIRTAAEHHVPSGPRRAVLNELFTAVAAVRKEPTVATSEVDMAAEESAPAGTTTSPSGAGAKPKLSGAANPEFEAYFIVLALAILAHYKSWEAVYTQGAAAVDYLDGQNRRTLDFFSARIYSFVALAHEKLKQAPEALLTVLSAAHRNAALRHDDYGTATLLNLMLRTHLLQSNFDAASKLIAKASFPEAASNAQFVRYLYYQGRIQAVQLAYSDAHASLTQAIRKAPPSAVGFRARATQLSVLVQLLMGDVPERSTFTSKDTAAALAPYLHITRAVRSGDLAAFNAALATHSAALSRDGTLTLANRLAANVIKAGLRSIALAYSRISFAHIASKLSLSSAEDAEFLAAKAIRDGVIDAELVHEATGGVMVSREVTDVYSTKEPQEAFHRRITFCLDVHNEAIKSMRYPPHAHREDLETAEKRAAREADEAELLKELEEGGLDEDDE